mgnify:CR=1 FL=1
MANLLQLLIPLINKCLLLFHRSFDPIRLFLCLFGRHLNPRILIRIQPLNLLHQLIELIKQELRHPLLEVDIYITTTLHFWGAFVFSKYYLIINLYCSYCS